MADGQQTHDDIPEIPVGVTLPDSTGSLIPDVETPEPELYGDEVLPLEEDTIEDQIDGEHPDGDYPQDIYDDDPDEPIEDEAADEEDEGVL